MNEGLLWVPMQTKSSPWKKQTCLSKHCVFRDQQSLNYHSRSASNPTQPVLNALTACCPWHQSRWFSPSHPRPSSAIPYPYTSHCGGRFCFRILLFLSHCLLPSLCLFSSNTCYLSYDSLHSLAPNIADARCADIQLWHLLAPQDSYRPTSNTTQNVFLEARHHDTCTSSCGPFSKLRRRRWIVVHVHHCYCERAQI
jgi:hypothetical protein